MNLSDLNSLSSIPPFSNALANKQRRLFIVTTAIVMTTAAVAAVYGILFVSRGSGYAIAMAAWLPIFVVGFPGLTYAYKIQAAAEKGDSEPGLFVRARRIGLAIFAVSESVVVVAAWHFLF